MATGTTVTFNGSKGWYPTEILPLLQQAKKTWRIDAEGMAEGGSCLTSSFTSYCDLQKMQDLMNESGQQYKGTAVQYAVSYNKLFEIDC
jgi:hypothetical protein